MLENRSDFRNYLFRIAKDPCGIVVLVSMLLTITVILLFSPLNFKNDVTSPTNGRCPISWEIANSSFINCK